MMENTEIVGRKHICKFLGCESWVTAKKRLKDRGLFRHNGQGKPTLNILVWNEVSRKEHAETPA